MAKFEKGDRFTLGSLTGEVDSATYGGSYIVYLDGHRYFDTNARVSNNFRQDFFDANAEKITPSARDRLKDLAPGTVLTLTSAKGNELWGRVVFLRLANTDDHDRGQMIYGYGVGNLSAQEFFILNTDTITIE